MLLPCPAVSNCPLPISVAVQSSGVGSPPAYRGTKRPCHACKPDKSCHRARKGDPSLHTLMGDRSESAGGPGRRPCFPQESPYCAPRAPKTHWPFRRRRYFPSTS
jgi:hypothetical protein